MIGGIYVGMGCCGNWKMYVAEEEQAKPANSTQMKDMNHEVVQDEESAFTAPHQPSQDQSAFKPQPSAPKPQLPSRPQPAPAQPQATNEERAWPEEDY